VSPPGERGASPAQIVLAAAIMAVVALVVVVALRRLL
jgi:hypothetical protein